MSGTLRLWLIGLLSIFLVGFLYSHSGCEIYNDYDSCIKYYQLADNVSNIFSNTSTFNIDYNLYLDCVIEQKNQRNFNYNEIRDFCFSALTTKKPNFNLSCSHTLKGPLLIINCKGVYPTKDYELVFDLIPDKNSLNVKPNILLSPNYSLTKPEFVFTQKEFNLSNTQYNANVKILPLTIQIKDSSDVSFLNTPILSNDLDDIYKAYLDCLTIKGLFSKYDSNNYYIRESGYEFVLTKNDLIKSCIGDLRSSFIVDFDNYDLKKNNFRNYLDLTINEAISEQNDYSTKFMNDYFEMILDKYSEYLLSINKYKNEDKSLKLSLDPDYLFEQIIKITKNLPSQDKSIILENVTPTILKNKEDIISIRRKNSVNSIISFFNNDINQIKDSEIITLYTNIEEIVLKNYFKNNKLADVCDVNFILTPKSISINDFSFDLITTLNACINTKNILVNSKENKLYISTTDYNFDTTLTLEFKDKMYVSGKEVNILSDKIIKNKPYKNISLIYDVVPIYVITTEKKGKLLGIININELIIEKYNASNLELYSTEKPWWDFLIIYR
jgi:hypothetical protein